MAIHEPITTIRVGRGIKATIWENTGKNGSFHNVTLSRTYKDKDGKFQDTASFGKDELLLVAKAADAAWEFLQSQDDEN